MSKYRDIRVRQSSLLRLSEFAGAITDIQSFYQVLNKVLNRLLLTNHYHIVLLNSQQQLKLNYSNNREEEALIGRLNDLNWQQSLTAFVFKEQRAIHCNAAERIALRQAARLTPENETCCVDWMGVPLKRGNQVIGVIALHSYKESHYFNARDCQLLEFIAENLVVAIDRVNSRELLEQGIQERTRKLTKTNQKLQLEIAERQKAQRMHETLLAISEITAKSEDLSSFYQSLHHTIKTLLPAENFYITLTLPNGAGIEHAYFIDEHSNDIRPRLFSEHLSEQTISQGLPILISEDKQFVLNASGDVVEQEMATTTRDKFIAKAWLSAPLIDQDSTLGMFAVQDYNDELAYQQSDLELIRFVAHHIAIAIMRKRIQLQEIENKDLLEKQVKERTQALEVSNFKLRMQVEERKKAEEKLFYDAHHDILTKLPNRAMFSNRLTYALNRYKRHSNHRLAVLFIDLDRFKMINDTLGHLAGDEFLVEISARLSRCIRENDLLARLGGDEFVILLDSCGSEEDIEEVATRIINEVSKPYTIDNSELYSNASIGIALFNPQYKSASELLRDADAAMYQAKSLGRGRYVFFDESMREQLIANLTLEQELRSALKEQQFELHYQEISHLDSTNVIGFEAFLRWQHPVKGMLTPSEFLSLAEETGIILMIETWVIEQVSLQLKLWENDEKHQHSFISINLSNRHLTQVNQINKLIQIISENTAEPERLILEFSESAFTQHADIALKSLRALKKFGVKLALDDYGASMSSFNLLHNYPFEFIKLDKSFVRSLSHSQNNFTLIKALHSLGEQFGYRLVAEGIESEVLLNKLLDIGCEFGQGYHLSKPEKLINTIHDEFNDHAERA